MKKTNGKNGAGPRMRASAQAVWLAGLGALAAAGEESNRIFRQLVKRGEHVDRVGRTRVQKLVARADDLRHEAGASIGSRIRKPIDRGVSTALHRLGVPTRSEILALTRRVEGLTRVVEKQRRARTARKPAAHPAA